MSNELNANFDIQSNFLAIKDEAGDPLPALRFSNSMIVSNWSHRNLIHILYSTMHINNCKVLDNYSLFVTHGITLTSSKLSIDLTYFNFSTTLLARLDSLKLDKLDTGIFNL